MEPICVLVVDDQQIIRSGLAAIFGQYPDIRIVAEAASGVEALEHVDLSRVDVALVDSRMPAMSGAELIGRIKERAPEVKCILLTAFDEEEALVAALRAGACGHLLKDVSAQQLHDAVVAAYSGEKVFDAQTVDRLSRIVTSQCARETDSSRDDVGETTWMEHRDARIIHLIAQGKTNLEIAKILCLSVGTVKNRISYLLKYYGVHNRAALAMLAEGCRLPLVP